ncbi:MAG: hypothetical protein KatS3mg105_5022 [Gemmatales bacterium]|nr:MAG: hypothetical protein KatS3mg105_5022 [Gemmatales bacterium]
MLGGGSGSARAIKAGKAEVVFSIRDNTLGQLKQIEAQFANWASRLRSIGLKMAGFGGLLASPFLGFSRIANTVGHQIQQMMISQRMSAAAAGRMLGLSESETEVALKFAETWDIVETSLRRVALTVLEALAPYIEQLGDLIVSMLPRLLNWIKNNKELILTVLKISAIVAAVGGSLVALSLVFGSLASVVAFVTGVIAAFGAVVGAVITVITSLVALISSPLILGIGALGALVFWLSGSFGELRASVESFADRWADSFGAMKDAILAGDFQLAFKIFVAGLKLEWQKLILAMTQLFVSWLEKVTVALSVIKNETGWVGRQLAAIGEFVGIDLGLSMAVSRGFVGLQQDRVKRLEQELNDLKLEAREKRRGGRSEQTSGDLIFLASVVAKAAMSVVAAEKRRQDSKNTISDIASQVAGTFSSYALAQTFGIGNKWSERIARGIDRVARATENIDKKMDNLPAMRFGP